MSFLYSLIFFFFKAPATTEIYTLSLHDALPIFEVPNAHRRIVRLGDVFQEPPPDSSPLTDRKSTRLNSSHQIISYAVFCLKKKKPKLNNNFSLGCSWSLCPTCLSQPVDQVLVSPITAWVLSPCVRASRSACSRGTHVFLVFVDLFFF